MDCFSSIFFLFFQDFYTIVLDELVLEVAARHRDDVLAQPPDQDYNRSRIHTAYRHAAGLWFSPGTLVSFTNKTDSHDIAEILLKVALNTVTLTLKHHSTNVGFLITGTMLMEILREWKIIIQKEIKVQILIRKIINANNMNSYKTLHVILMNISTMLKISLQVCSTAEYQPQKL